MIRLQNLINLKKTSIKFITKLSFILIVFSLISCKSIEIENIDIETSTVKNLQGKVKELEIISCQYYTNNINSEKIDSLNIHSIIFFNKKKRILKQIDSYPNFKSEVNYNYKNKLLVSTVTKIANRIDRTEYKYDEKKNLINYKSFQNDTLCININYKYDLKNNPILVQKIFYIDGKEKRKDNFKNIYNYKDQTVKQCNLNQKNSDNGFYITYYDDKGKEIKSESIDSLENIKNSVTYEYDKSGNLIKKINTSNQQRQIHNYEYKFDKRKNIIQIIEIFENKTMSKTNIMIKYW